MEGFTAPKGVTWGEEDQAKLKTWDYFGEEAWEHEAIFLMDNRKELEGGASHLLTRTLTFA